MDNNQIFGPNGKPIEKPDSLIKKIKWLLNRFKKTIVAIGSILATIVVFIGNFEKVEKYLYSKMAVPKNEYKLENKKDLTNTSAVGIKSIEPEPSSFATSIYPEMIEIPAGEFLYGDPNDTNRSRKHLSAFWISKYEITNKQYKKYLDENPKVEKPCLLGDKDYNSPQKPVVCVSWHDARNYSLWLSEKKRYNYSLPTKEQWEKAARGLTNNIYPWGNSSPTPKKANFNNQHGYPHIITAHESGKSQNFRIYNMAGNVAEWCTNVASDSILVKGGSFKNSAYFLKIHVHNEQKPNGLPWVGFRVVMSK